MDTPKDIIDLIEKKAIVKQEVYANTQLQFNLLKKIVKKLNKTTLFINSVEEVSFSSYKLFLLLNGIKWITFCINLSILIEHRNPN